MATDDQIRETLRLHPPMGVFPFLGMNKEQLTCMARKAAALLWLCPVLPLFSNANRIFVGTEKEAVIRWVQVGNDITAVDLKEWAKFEREIG